MWLLYIYIINILIDNIYKKIGPITKIIIITYIRF